MAPDSDNPSQQDRITSSAAARALPRRLLQLLGRELDYRDARHLRRHWCWPCDKRTFLQHAHTDAFVKRRP